MHRDSETVEEPRAGRVDLPGFSDDVRAIFDLAPIGMAVSALDGRLLHVNKALCDTLGQTAEDVIGRPFDQFTHPDDLEESRAYIAGLLANGESDVLLQKRYQRPDGSSVHALLKAGLVRTAEGEPSHFIAQVLDVEERVQAERRLLWAAEHDALTSLPNRARFLAEMESAIATADAAPFALAFLDLDAFKVVNDSLGHHAGDELLRGLATRIRRCLGQKHMVARHGGDEFTILLRDTATGEEAQDHAEWVLSAMKAPMRVAGVDLYSSGSIGIVLCRSPGSCPDNLLRDADTAMYQAKQAGRGRSAVFDVAMREDAVGRLQLESDLGRAAERGEFEVRYQPIVSLMSEEVLGFEALMRWRHPTRGLLAPGEFLEAAETTGRIVEAGHQVLLEACSQLCVWQEQFERPPFVSVNLSVRELAEPALLETIDSALATTRARASGLRIEITESGVWRDEASTEQLLHKLRARGVRIYIDDFGTGWSSYARLQRLPVDALKIDRGFIDPLCRNVESTELIKALLALASGLGIEAIAEGIETVEQLAVLRALGCRSGQGYLFAKPLEAEDATALLEQSLIPHIGSVRRIA